MAWAEVVEKRTLSAKTWRDSDNPLKHVRVERSGAVLHYPTAGPDSEVLDGQIAMEPVRVDVPIFDGWRITQAGWHYALGKDIANHGNEDGWVGFGGRAGEHWLKFRMLRAGYLHWPTRAWQDVGGAPTYDRANLSLDSTILEMGPNDEPVIVSSKATWGGMWNTPGGGEVSISWRAEGGQLKEEIYLNQAGREWIAANRPPATPPAETYFGFVFKLDASDIPRWVKNNILQNLDGDFDDDGTNGIECQDSLGRLITFMPVSSAYSDFYIDGEQKTRDEIKLKKRLWLDGDGNHYLLVGALATDLNGMRAGGITFDPTNTYQPGSGRDTYLDSASVSYHWGTRAWFNCTAAAYNGLIEFDISDIDSDATCDSCEFTLWSHSVQGGSRDVEVRELLAANDGWPVGPSANPATDVCTWSHHTIATQPWAGSAGCGTEGTDYSSDQIGELFYDTNSGSTNTPSATALISSDVQDWFGATNENYGMILLSYAIGTSTPSLSQWQTSEGENGANSYPKLEVAYTSGAPPPSFAVATATRHMATLRGE